MARCKYDPETFPILAEMYAREGMIEIDIAKKLGISKATFEDYKNKFPDFLDSLKRGKAPVDFEVEKSLLKRASGYMTTETTVTINPDGSRTVKTTDKEVPPDPTSMIFWLKNRNPKEWRDKQELEHSGSMGVMLVDDIPRKKRD